MVHTNGYFTFTDNPVFSDVKVSVIPRWCKEEHLGKLNMSKTVTPAHFGETRVSLVRAMMVLKAWMLWRAQTGDFCNKRAARRKLFAGEARNLKAAIVEASSASLPTTGNAAADALIRKWAPDVLAAS